MNAVVDMVELGHDTEPTAAEVRSPVLRELRQLACEHVAFLNDLASYHREVVRAGSSFNLLHSIAMESCEGSISRAVPLLAAELNAIITRFEALATGLRGKQARHAAALRCMMAGNHRFSFHGGRYHHPEAHLVELRGIPSDAPPSTASDAPPPTPSVAPLSARSDSPPSTPSDTPPATLPSAPAPAAPSTPNVAQSGR